ncbi:MAG: helix-turn-helix domain-containing protein [Acidimicrobiales bacterium]
MVKPTSETGLSGPEGGAEQESTRERILDIAMELFTEQGYEKTSLRQIAERLGFSKAAIYYHFASKDEILLALHMRLHEFGRGALSTVDLGDLRSGAWLELLNGLVEQILRHRSLFVLHERNRAALEQLHRQGHDAEHEDLDILFRQVLANPALSARERVRLACTFGAVMGPLVLSGEVFADIPTDQLGALVREAAHDLLLPVAPV